MGNGMGGSVFQIVRYLAAGGHDAKKCMHFGCGAKYRKGSNSLEGSEIATLQFCCQRVVNTVTMVLCNTMYTLISIYLWGGFVSSQCFFPDGTPTEDVQDGYYPCNSTTGDQASSCCQLTTSTCTTGGYCIGKNGFPYRGACTNPNFPVPCPHYCVDGE